MIAKTAEKIAQVRGETTGTLLTATLANARRFFRL